MVARIAWKEPCMQVYEGEAWSLLETLKYAANKEPRVPPPCKIQPICQENQ
ncbi:hypothetical protein JHK85_006795 [Glycine max]|nr:hypothetical protein JHK85_006795 [Glycine max]KAG5071394.1 hypothetical protein JHK86_006605 [Glycine max]